MSSENLDKDNSFEDMTNVVFFDEEKRKRQEFIFQIPQPQDEPAPEAEAESIIEYAEIIANNSNKSFIEVADELIESLDDALIRLKEDNPMISVWQELLDNQIMLEIEMIRREEEELDCNE
jgi:hypothetical protein